MAFKGFSAFVSRVRDTGEQVNPNNILWKLENISKATNEAVNQNKTAIEMLRAAISSETDSSLATQIQKLRATVSDGQDELIKEFKEFAANMAENNQKILIEALESVTRDFNEKLNEQFEENCWQLDRAVEKLVV